MKRIVLTIVIMLISGLCIYILYSQRSNYILDTSKLIEEDIGCVTLNLFEEKENIEAFLNHVNDESFNATSTKCSQCILIDSRKQYAVVYEFYIHLINTSLGNSKIEMRSSLGDFSGSKSFKIKSLTVWYSDYGIINLECFWDGEHFTRKLEYKLKSIEEERVYGELMLS